MAISFEKDTAPYLVLGRMFDLERIVGSRTCGRIIDLQVESFGDRIEIHGSTSTYYAKQLATQIVREEFSEIELTNCIEVR